MDGGCISNSQRSNYNSIYKICSGLEENNDVCPDRKSINLYERFSPIDKYYHLNIYQLQGEFVLLTKLHPIDRYEHLDELSKSKKENDIAPEKKYFYKRPLQKVKNVPKVFADLGRACKKYFCRKDIENTIKNEC